MSDELDPALRALLKAERSAPLAGAAEAKAQILANVLTASGGVAAGGAAAGGAVATGGWSTKALLMVALGTGILGAGAGSVITTALTPAVTPASPAEDVSVQALEEPEQASTPMQDEEPSTPQPSTPPPDTPQPDEASERRRPSRTDLDRAQNEPVLDEREETTEHEPSSLGAERALIDQALSALRGRHPQSALVALMSHERRFPHGALSEERDRLSVEALVQLGRSEQARARARLFESRYPQSAHLGRVRSLVESPEVPL